MRRYNLFLVGGLLISLAGPVHAANIFQKAFWTKKGKDQKIAQHDQKIGHNGDQKFEPKIVAPTHLTVVIEPKQLSPEERVRESLTKTRLASSAEFTVTFKATVRELHAMADASPDAKDKLYELGSNLLKEHMARNPVDWGTAEFIRNMQLQQLVAETGLTRFLLPGSYKH